MGCIAFTGGAAHGQGQDFDFGDGRHGSYIVPPGTITVQQLWSDITGNAQGVYDPANDNQIPQFENLTISNGTTLTVDPFNGDPSQPVNPRDGGVIRLKVRGTLRIEAAGRIDASGRGYSGGRDAQVAPFGAGQQGDSWGSTGANNTIANRGGGGGGAGESILGNRQPQSGAGGGHAASGGPGDPALLGNAQGGASFDEVGASLGAAFVNQYPFPRFGSGGGRGGYADNFANTFALGGNGGGVILIEARFIINAGAMRADGAVGGNGLSGGGGGAGGSILVRSLSNLNGTVSVNGGNGGSGSWNPSSRGGGGSPGIRVWEQRYVIEREVVGNGSIVLDPNQEQYGEGDVVTVTAVADPGWRFLRWEEALTTSTNPAQLEILGPVLLRAVFEEPPVISLLPLTPQVGPQAQQITFQVTNVGGGQLSWIASIQSDPDGILTILSQTPNQNTRGDGRFVVQVAENRSLFQRQAVVIVEGSDPDTPPVSATITQLPAVPILQVQPVTTNVAGSPGAASISVQNLGTGDMPWTADVISGGNFLTITSGTSGNGAGAINVAFLGNPTAAPRTAVIRVESPGAQGSPRDVSVVQAAGKPILSVTPQNQTVDASADTINFIVANAGNGSMPWTAEVVTGGGFLSIVGGASGTNAGVVSVALTENTGSQNRSGTIRVEAPEVDNSPIILTITQLARERVLVLSTDTLNVAPTAGSASFGVQNAGTGTMTWNATVRSGADFITIAGGTGTGVNTGVVNLQIAENPRNEPRVGTVEVSAPGAFNSPQTVTVTQAAQNIVLEVTPAEIDVGPKGGPVSFTVRNAGTGTMLWNAAVQSGADFATLTSGASGANTGVVQVVMAENTTGQARVATVLVSAPEAGNSPVTVAIRQAPSDNRLQVSPLDIDIGSNGGPLSFTVQNQGTGTLPWTAVVQTGADFLTIAGGSGVGVNTGVVGLIVAENERDTPRTGTVLVSSPEADNSPVVVTIRQARREAVLEVSPTELNVGATGGNLTFGVQNGGTGTMNWTASVQTGGDFVSIENNPATGQTSGVGVNTGTVRLAVRENPGNTVRVATILVGALGAANSPVTVTITQAPANAVLEVNPGSLSVGAAGGPLGFTVQNAGSGTMNWTAAVQSGADFLSVVAGTGTGVNTGAVALNVTANTTGLPRSGTVLVSAPGATNSPATITVTQSGGNNVLQVAPTALSVGASGGDSGFTVRNAGTGNMNWSATVQAGADFLLITPGTGGGINDGGVSLRILENNSDAPREGRILVEAPGADNSPITVTVAQSARAAVLLVNPATLNADPAGGPLSFTVENTGTGSMNWAASVQSGADFVRIVNNAATGLSSGFGTNTGTVLLEVDENTAASVRVATVQVQAVGAANSPATVTITQGPRNVILQVTPASRVIGAGSGEVQFDIRNAGSGTMGFSTSVQDGADFLGIAADPGTGQSSGSGVNTGTVRVTVAANRTGAARVGTLRVDAPGAQGNPALVSITQLAQDLSLLVTPQQQSIGSEGGGVGFTIENLGSGVMTWTATLEEGAAFVTLPPDSAAGSGDGAVVLNVAANRTGAARAAVLRIDAPGAANSPARVVVNQVATASVLRVTPREQAIGSRAGALVFQVENAGTGSMPWVASVTAGANFVSIREGVNGVDAGAITVSVEANTGTADREATIRVDAPGAQGAPVDLRVLQRAGDTILRVTPINQNIGAAGGIIEFQVENAGAGQLRWTASMVAGANFARVTSPVSGIEDAVVQVTVDPSTESAARVARLRIEANGAAGSPVEATITQALCEVPRAPVSLSASDGALTNAIELRWTAVPGAQRYEIYRNDLNDAGTAALVGSTDADTRIFLDLGAAASQVRRTGGGCLAPAQFQFFPRRHHYWVAAVNECGVGTLSLPDTGYRAVRLSTGQIISAEKALPAAQAGGVARVAAPGDALHVRLGDDAGIATETLWAEVHADGTTAVEARWLPVDGDRDGWVVVAPDWEWTSGDVVAVSVGAVSLEGDPVGPVVATFEIGDAPAAAAAVLQPVDGSGVSVVEEPVVGSLPLPGAAGPAYRVLPGAPFAAAQRVWLPVPAGADPSALRLFAYLGDPETGGWFPLENVAGLPDDEAPLWLHWQGRDWLGVTLRHGAVLRLADPDAVAESAAAVLPVPRGLPGAGAWVVAALALLVLVGASRGRGRARS